ncbi:MAG: PpiC-type peptidyl-prolyl cis-trans isomerase [Tardiphaga sp.]|nr:PpiC-type peptidyl-prolyl cis-trans isomerase [Tardiphaga sp.]
MLRGIRKASSNWVGKTIMTIVMGVLIVSFGVWGIADIFKGFGQSSLAKVGNTEISTEQFRQTFTDRLQQVGRQFGRPLTMDQARTFGLDRQVLQQVVSEAALDEDARRMGLAQSDAEVMRTIYNDPNFKGPNGQFDPNRFVQIVRQIGYTEQRYIAEQRKVGLRRQIAGTITAGLEPSKTQIDALVRFQNEQRSIDYVKLSAAQAGTIADPTPEVLAAYYEDNKTQFRAPEFRKIGFVVMTPDELAKWSTVSDEDARKAFDANQAKLATPERRQLSQLVFPTMDDAKAAREKIAAGTSFEDIAKERGSSPADIDLGKVAKAEVIDPAVADAAFALPTGDVSQPVQGRFGVVLVKAGEITPGVTPSYDSVAATIKRDLARERAVAQVNDLHNKIEDERGGGANVVEAAKKIGLTPVTLEAVDRSGRGPDGQPVAGIPPGVNIVPQAFASDVGVDTEAITFNGGYVYYDVMGVTPSRERTLDEVKDQVATRWRDQQVTDRLKAKAADMVQQLNQGGTLAALASADNLKVETATNVKRDASVPGLPASTVEAAFRGAKDAAGQTPGTGGSEWIVYRVTDISVPTVDMASEDIKKLTETLQRGLNDEQIAQYISTVEKQIGTSINQSAFAQVTGAAGSNN